MFQRIMVAVDGSARSLTAVQFGAQLAAAVGADLDVVAAVAPSANADEMKSQVEASMADLGALPIAPTVGIAVGGTVAPTLSESLATRDGSLLVLGSTGRGRSAIVLGSVADEMLRSVDGPIAVLGPNAELSPTLSGPILVPVDGSEVSESILPFVATWAGALGAIPWLLEVSSGDDDAYPARLATDLGQVTGGTVEWEVLHGHPGRSIVEHASRRNASLIMMSTHGRSGVKRLALGSVAADIVHAAPCPVILHRPLR